MNEFDSPNFCEYVWDRKAEGKEKILKALLIVSYVLFVILFFGVCYFTRIIPLFALCPIFTWILIFFTWPLVSYDCYFTISEGYLELGRIRVKKSGRKKTPLARIHVKEAEYAGVFCESENCRVRLSELDSLLDIGESRKSENRIFIVWCEGERRRGALFEGTAKAAKLISSLCDGGKSLRGEKLHG